MLASRVGRHRLELVVAVCAIAALVAVAASTRTTTQTFARSESWRHATGSLAALTASSHVWLEEIFAGDTGNDPQRDVLAPLGHAHVLCEALRFGGTTPMGRVEPVQPANRARVDALCEDLVRLGTLSRQRLAAPGTSRAGTVMDARYDAVFHRIEDNADGLGNDLAATVRSERASAQHLNAGLLLSLLVIFAAMGVMGRRHVRERLVRQRLEALARTDPLTGLANHRHFHERLRAELDRAGRDGTNLALVVLDLDHFAGLNDRRGHRFGDRVLSEIAATIGAGVRASDLVARVARRALRRAAARRHGPRRGGHRRRAPRARRPGAPRRLRGHGLRRRRRRPGRRDRRGRAHRGRRRRARLGQARRPRPDPPLRPARTSAARSLQQRRAEILALLDGEDTMRPVFQPLVDLETAEVAGYEALTRFPGTATAPSTGSSRPAAAGSAGRSRRARSPSRSPPRAAPTAPSSPSTSARPACCPRGRRALPADLDGVVVELTENETADAPGLPGLLDDLRARGALIAVDDAGAGHAGLQQLMSVGRTSSSSTAASSTASPPTRCAPRSSSASSRSPAAPGPTSAPRASRRPRTSPRWPRSASATGRATCSPAPLGRRWGGVDAARGRSRSTRRPRTRARRGLLLSVELVRVALAGPGLGAEPALQPAGRHARRRPAGLRIAGPAAVGRPVAVAAGLDALGLAALLGEVRRPRRVAQALLLVAPRELQQLVERAGLLVDVARRVAERAQAVRDRVEAEVLGLGVGDLVPRAARTTRARPASGGPSSRRRRSGRARSGCSRRTRRGAPPSTTCSSRARAHGAPPRARARAPRGARRGSPTPARPGR